MSGWRDIGSGGDPRSRSEIGLALLVLVVVLLVLALLNPFGCGRHRVRPFAEDAARTQNEEGERGCALPVQPRTMACSGPWCLVCWPAQRSELGMEPALCVSVPIDGCP